VLLVPRHEKIEHVEETHPSSYHYPSLAPLHPPDESPTFSPDGP
jgi:hypothetical protein